MTTTIQIGECCVDSGQIMIVDPCYVSQEVGQPRKFEDNMDDYDQFFDLNLPRGYQKAPSQAFSYVGACIATQHGGGQLKNAQGAPLAVATSTHWGDGSYPVTAEVGSDGNVVSVTIHFDEMMDSCEDCGDEIPLGTALCSYCQDDRDEQEADEYDD